MAQCVCSSHPTSVPTSWLECVHASVHVVMSIWIPISVWPPLHSYIETWVAQCSTVCVFQSPHFWSHTLVRMWTYISTCTYIYLTPHVCFIPLAYLHGNMGSSVWQCVCCNHSTSVPTPWLEDAYATVQVFMSIWLPVTPQTPMDSYMETWVPLCGTVFVSKSAHFCSATLFRMCTSNRTSILVDLTLHLFSTLFA